MVQGDPRSPGGELLSGHGDPLLNVPMGPLMRPGDVQETPSVPQWPKGTPEDTHSEFCTVLFHIK